MSYAGSYGFAEIVLYSSSLLIYSYPSNSEQQPVPGGSDGCQLWGTLMTSDRTTTAAAQLMERQRSIERILLLEVHVAASEYWGTSVDPAHARARDRYVRALNAFSDFVLHGVAPDSGSSPGTRLRESRLSSPVKSSLVA